MDEPVLDIQQERIGGFRIGQIIRLPNPIADDAGLPISDGDVVELVPYVGVSVLVLASVDASGLALNVIDLKADDTSNVLVFGQKLSAVALDELMDKLRALDIREHENSDSLLYLNDHATLGVSGNRVDMIWMGGDRRVMERPWRSIKRAETARMMIDLAASS